MGALLAGGISPAKAQDDSVYTVKGVQVDVSGTSALDARKKAFAEARRKAYGQLGDKLLSPAQRPNLVIPDDHVLAGLVRDFEIVNEKMTTKRYAGTMDIRFTPAAVKRTIQIADAPQTPVGDDTQTQSDVAAATTQTQTAPVIAGAQQPATGISDEDAESYIYSPARKSIVKASGDGMARPVVNAPAKKGAVLVLPWYGPVGRQTLWGQNNPWRDAWESDAAIARDKTMPVVLPVGDVDDLRDYSPPQPLSRRGDIAALLKRYEATQAVLAMAEQSTGGGLLVSLYQYQDGAPIPMGRFGMDASTNGNVMADAVKKAVASLRGMPAIANEVATAPTQVSITAPAQKSVMPAGGAYRTLARFSGLQQWVAMRQALSRVPGISGLNVRAISPSQASVDFTYTGDGNALAGMLAQSGLQLEPAPQGISTGDRPAQYTLSMARGY